MPTTGRGLDFESRPLPKNLEAADMKDAERNGNAGRRAWHPMGLMRNLFVEEDGQDMVEYGLVIALVVIAAASVLSGFKSKISTGFSSLGTSVTTSL
jgi:pilus assembly protein Flp/PilA